MLNTNLNRPVPSFYMTVCVAFFVWVSGDRNTSSSMGSSICTRLLIFSSFKIVRFLSVVSVELFCV